MQGLAGKVMFPGTECFPLSPSMNSQEPGPEDQLTMILNIFGNLDADDTAFVSEVNT